MNFFDTLKVDAIFISHLLNPQQFENEFDETFLKFDPVDPFNKNYDIKLIEQTFNTTNSGIGTESVGFVDLFGSVSVENTVTGIGTTTIVSLNSNNFESLYVNAQVIDTVTNEMNYARLYIAHDGTNSYIKGGSEYTINVGLIINQRPVAGIIYAPKKKRLFYAYGKNEAYEIFNKNKKIRLNCSKKLKREKIALTNSTSPSKKIKKLIKKYKINKFVSMRSSLKFCTIASCEFDFYSAKPRAREWDYAAGHAIAESAGAIIRTFNNKKILYGKKHFKNPSLLVRRNSNI